MIDERKDVQTAPTRTYFKRSRPLPYPNPNKQDAPALEVYPAPSHHPTTPEYSKIPILRPPFGLPKSGLIREEKTGLNSEVALILGGLNSDISDNLSDEATLLVSSCSPS